MTTRSDPAEVLRCLAKDLDVDGTLDRFPGLTREGLAEIIDRAADAVPGRAVTAVLFTDGGARGNPGPAGAGVVIRADGAVVRVGEYLGEATNNVAEYRALILGLEKAAAMGVEELEIRADSELVIRQLKGLYKVKSPVLMDLYFTAIRLLSGFRKSTLVHVPRDQNQEADRLANMAIDKKGSVSF